MVNAFWLGQESPFWVKEWMGCKYNETKGTIQGIFGQNVANYWQFFDVFCTKWGQKIKNYLKLCAKIVSFAIVVIQIWYNGSTVTRRQVIAQRMAKIAQIWKLGRKTRRFLAKIGWSGQNFEKVFIWVFLVRLIYTYWNQEWRKTDNFIFLKISDRSRQELSVAPNTGSSTHFYIGGTGEGISFFIGVASMDSGFFVMGGRGWGRGQLSR